MISIAHIHPSVVHFPIVFFLTLAAFDALAAVRGTSLAGRSGAANMSAGLALLAGLSAIVAFGFGDIAYDIARDAGFPEARLETHEALGTWMAILLLAWAVARSYLWWRGSALVDRYKMAVVGLEIAGAVLIIATAYFGGQLVYNLGVNVARAVGS